MYLYALINIHTQLGWIYYFVKDVCIYIYNTLVSNFFQKLILSYFYMKVLLTS